MNIHDIYLDYLKYKNEENADARNDGKFHASSAGSCYRKQLYRLYEFPQDSMDDKSYKILRLGTVVHKDFEDSMHYHIKTNAKEIIDNKVSIFSEHKVNLEEYNVTGTLDIGEYIDNDSNKVFNLYDLKTTAAYKWSTMFGIKKNKQPVFEFDKYRMQLATYGMGMKEELDINELNMFLVFYNKNTSMIREVKVYADEWIDKAKTYWEELNGMVSAMGEEYFEEKLRPGWQFGVPYEDWECNYCNYKTICPSKLIK